MFRPPPRPGVVAVYVAASLTMLLGILAVAVDASNMYSDHRRSQNAADAAALAAATQMFKDWNTGQGALSTAATTSAKHAAQSYGFVDTTLGGTATVAVSQPTSGTFSGAGYVQVTITYPQNKYFSTIFGGGALNGQVTAIARGRMSTASSPTVLVLNRMQRIDAVLTGNASIQVPDSGSVVINSPSGSGLTMTGNAQIIAGSVMISGPGASTSGNATFVNNEGTPITPEYNAPPTPDPYVNITPPSASGRTNYSAVSLSGQQTQTLSPGVYPSISTSVQSSIVLQPGVYIITGNGSIGLALTGSGNVTVDTSTPNPETGTGVFFYLTGGQVSLTGSGSTILPAPTAGPWQGISLWVDKNNPAANNDQSGMTLTGNSTMQVGGVLYGPTTLATFTGNGYAVGSQAVVDMLTITGNGSTKLGNSGSQAAPPVKQLGLVQ